MAVANGGSNVKTEDAETTMENSGGPIDSGIFECCDRLCSDHGKRYDNRDDLLTHMWEYHAEHGDGKVNQVVLRGRVLH